MIRYISYCRKSTEDDTHQQQSLDTQKRILKDVAIKQHLTIVDTVFESKSAKLKGNRPEFIQMLNRIKKGEAEAILVSHTDRLTRNLNEADLLLELYDSGNLKEIKTPYNVYSSYRDIYYLCQDFLMATQYSRDLSVKVKEGMSSKALSGIFPGHCPLGYLNINGRVEVDIERAENIKLMFKLFSTGNYTIKQLTKEVNDRGLRTRKGYKLTLSQVHRMLMQIFYTGDFIMKDKLYKGKHKALISKELFEKVQYVRTGKKRDKKVKYDFLYRPLLTCAICGCLLTATVKKEKYKYYYCTNGKKECTQHKKYLREELVDSLVMKEIKKIQVDPKLAELSLKLYIEKNLNTDDSIVTKIKNAEKELQEISKKEEVLLNKLIAETITDEIYSSKRESFEMNKQEVEDRISKYKEEDPKVTLELLEGLKNTVCSIEKMFKNGNEEVKRELLNSLLWNLQVKDQNIFSAKYKLPFALFENAPKNGDIDKWWAI